VLLIGSSYLSQNSSFKSKNLVLYLKMFALQNGNLFIQIWEFRLSTIRRGSRAVTPKHDLTEIFGCVWTRFLCGSRTGATQPHFLVASKRGWILNRILMRSCLVSETHLHSNNMFHEKFQWMRSRIYSSQNIFGCKKSCSRDTIKVENFIRSIWNPSQ